MRLSSNTQTAYIDSILVGPQYYGVTSLWSQAADGGVGQCVLNAAPKAQWTTSSLSFGLVTVGSQGAQHTATLQNTGTAELLIGSGDPQFPAVGIVPSGPFYQDFQLVPGGDGCDPTNSPVGTILFPSPGPAFNQCGVSLTFTPSSTGTEQAQLFVESNDPNTADEVLTLEGFGLPGNVRFSTSPLGFPPTLSTLAGAGSDQRSTRNIGFSNTDSVPHVISGVGVRGSNPRDFAVAGDGCTGHTLLPGQSCSITVSFLPLQTGQRVALLQVADNALGSPHRVPLVGTGLGPSVRLTSGPNATPTVALNFGDVRHDTLSAPQFLTLTSTGQTPLVIQSIVPSGDFRLIRTSCPLAPNALAVDSACTIEIALAAVHGPAETGTLAITDNANSSPQQVRLSGEVVAPAASFSAKALRLSSSIEFSSAEQVRLINTGGVPLSIASITTSGPFTQTSTCPVGSTSALGSQACTITVTFKPTACGPASGSLTVTDDALPDGSQVLPLSGYGACILARGAFVVGDENATLGSTVTFWGAQWSSDNQLSGGPAPSDFKGYADTLATNPPACGQPWSAAPGRSVAPPASLPTYMAVIVAKHITQTGSVIGGQHIAHVVVVQTDPGYAPDPGHPGTGKIVAVLC